MEENAQAENQGALLLTDIIAHAKAYGFLYQSSEIYDGLQAVYDYGPYGAALKRNLQDLWWRSMTQLHANIVGIDAAIFMHPRTWHASGHVDGFNDLMVDNKDSQKRYRMDMLLEDQAVEYDKKGQNKQAVQLIDKMNALLEKDDLKGLHQLLLDENVVCPISNTANWTDVRRFNLMFTTQVGAVEGEAHNLYLRPETAQGIFVNFLNVQKTARMNVPFGIAQIGKAFRNEIIARQFIFRMREFEQMEMQFFIPPGEEEKWFDYWKDKRFAFHEALGIPNNKLRIHPHEQLAHYATAAIDIEYEFPFGFKEMEGVHSRTDFDLKRHQEFSKKKMQYFDPHLQKSYIPYVIETSVGCDRMVLMLLCQAFTKETTVHEGNEKSRLFLKLHPALAPIKAAILPLVKKDGLAEKATELFNDLKLDFPLVYEETQSLGKRYTRQDLIGTPYCITVDHQTLDDQTVTIRDRDTTQQERIAIDQIKKFLTEKTSYQTVLNQL